MFLVGDGAGLRELLGIEVWDRDPCCSFAPGDPAPRGESEERALAYRRRLIEEIEARAGFDFEDRRHEDEARAGEAWDKLGDLAVRVGVDPETWDRIRENAGWEKVPPQKGE